MASKNILIVEDTMALAMIYEECLKANYKTRSVSSGAAALTIVKNDRPDAILLDLGLPDIEGIEILKYIRAQGMDCAVIVITGRTSLNTAIEAMRAGADDFVAKPVDPERLQITLSNALEKRRLEQFVNTHQDNNRNNFNGIIGGSPEMNVVYNIIENAARSTAPVMITGESGTGKELAAQAIHSLSARKQNNIVALNCAAIPHDLLESEIFGHVKGAFTGAMSDRQGAAFKANHGTLFLDELAEMPLGLQSKLLRFIQTGSYSPVGSNEVIHVDIRFVCATNKSPLEAVQSGALREDLYYRLAVIPITLPPLRARGNDIMMLAQYFLEKATVKEKKKFHAFDAQAEKLLRLHTWPGNVRELENVIRYAVVMHNGEVVSSDMLKFLGAIQPQSPQRNTESTSWLPDNPDDLQPLDNMERMIIENAIKICGGNITEAARRLAINPSTIHRKQKEWKAAIA